jgi:hypothetical protein
VPHACPRALAETAFVDVVDASGLAANSTPLTLDGGDGKSARRVWPEKDWLASHVDIVNAKRSSRSAKQRTLPHATSRRSFQAQTRTEPSLTTNCRHQNRTHGVLALAGSDSVRPGSAPQR